MSDTTMPDFKQWVRLLMSLPPHSNHPSSIEQALKDAFNQGYALGHREVENEFEQYLWGN